MSNRELVIDIVKKLPDDTPVDEIIRQIEFVTGLNEALEKNARDLATSFYDQSQKNHRR